MRSKLKQLGGLLQSLYAQAHDALNPAVIRVKRYLARVDAYLKTRPRLRRWVVIASFIAGPPCSMLLVLFPVVWVETPGKRELRNIQNHVASEVYSADSVLLGRYYIQDRTEVAYDEIAPAVIDALLATEDVRFYQHEGVDFVSLGRVLVKSIFLRDESAGGGSTLTQQLAKNLYPRKRYWIFSMPVNKLREVITAQRLEDIYSKKELITLYLNTVPFADNTFGIEAAAQRFYSRQARALTVCEAAVLVGMLKATSYYNPRRFPERALQRRNVVLGQMVKYGLLAEAASDSLSKLPLSLKYNKISHHQGLAPYFREYMKTELMEWCDNHRRSDGEPYNLYTDGLKIYTTLDSRMQRYAEKAVAMQMTILQEQFFQHWGKEKPWKGKEGLLKEAIRRSSRYRQLAEKGLTDEAIMKEMRKPVPTRLFTWQGERDATASPIDSIMHHLQYLNAGFMVMEPATGKVKAWVGGIEHDFFQYDHVRETTKRQVGSILKPIVFAHAVEKGIAPCELIDAGQETYTDEEGELWTPRNSQNDYEVQYTMRGALAYSVNTVAVKLIKKAGVKGTIRLAEKMGITSNIPAVPSIALGSPSISLVEMTTAYACLANGGVTHRPRCITAIQDGEGKTYRDVPDRPASSRALSAGTAQLINHMLRTVVHEGTASRLRWKYGVYNDIGGKTGTTQSNADGWFMAITPALAMGSWVGADDPRIRFRSTQLGQGSNTALPIVAYFMQQLNKDRSLRRVADAKFPPLSPALQQKLHCDLYELNDDLWQQAAYMIFQRDSLLFADSTAQPPRESFLETLYKRKLKMQEASEQKDSIDDLNQAELTGG